VVVSVELARLETQYKRSRIKFFNVSLMEV
jgi:hypothetical protein